MSKKLRVASVILGVLLNFMLMILPSILLGNAQLFLSDRRLAVFLFVVSLWIILTSANAEQRYTYGLQVQGKWLPTLIRIAMLAIFLISLTEHAMKDTAPFSFLAIIGGILMIAGILLRQFAIRDLSPYFLDDLVIISGQELVTTGIYQHIRHPSELGNLWIAFGSSLLLSSTLGFVLCLFILLPVVAIRIWYEDRLLMRYYPQKFTIYKQTVPAIFSFKLFLSYWS